MSRTLLVLRYEISTAFRRPSFLFAVFGLPVFLGLALVLISRISVAQPIESAGPASAPDARELQREGYVDLSGLITEIHPDVPPGILTAYPDEDSARAALRAGAIKAYYLVPPNYLETGNVIYANPDYRPVSAEGQAWVMRWTLFANLVGNDPERMRAGNAMDVHTTTLAPEAAGPEGNSPALFFVPYTLMMLFTFVLMMSAGLLLSSVSMEKQNRTLETLLLSIDARQLLIGKITALGLLGLLQAVVWFSSAYVLLGFSGSPMELPPGLELPPSFIFWGIVFFVLSYAVYGSLMAGLGALTSNPREASQSIIIVIWPILVAFVISPVLPEEPHSALITGLSLFPLTAPHIMLGRLVIGGVPWWQPWLAAVLMGVTAVFIVRMVIGMFQAQILLTGQSFSVRRYFVNLVGRRNA